LLYNIGMFIKYATFRLEHQDLFFVMAWICSPHIQKFWLFSTTTLPWFLLLGIIISHVFYTSGKRQQYIFQPPDNIIIQWLTFAGTKTLFIYLIHQPIIIALIYLISYFC